MKTGPCNSTYMRQSTKCFRFCSGSAGGSLYGTLPRNSRNRRILICSASSPLRHDLQVLDTKRVAARRAQGVGWKRIAAGMGVGVGTIYPVTLEGSTKRILEPRQVCELADLFRSD